jgi:hypothetical protein
MNPLEKLKEKGAEVDYINEQIFVKFNGDLVCCRELEELFDELEDSYELVRFKRVDDEIYMTLKPIN